MPKQHAKTVASESRFMDITELRPVVCGSLARLGSANDGGYVVPLVAVQEADALLTFGLNHNWSFERDFKKLNDRAIIHCYDHTVSILWMDYLRFFRANNVHFRQRIWRDREYGSVTIDDAFGRLPNQHQKVFLKMDVEGSEYRVLDDLLKHSAKITAMTIEFHEIDLLPEQFCSFIRKIKRHFYIAHIHGNNNAALSSQFGFPIVVELTFLNKRFLSAAPLPSTSSYPIPELDRPNHPGRLDYTFVF